MPIFVIQLRRYCLRLFIVMRLVFYRGADYYQQSKKET